MLSAPDPYSQQHFLTDLTQIDEPDPYPGPQPAKSFYDSSCSDDFSRYATYSDFDTSLDDNTASGSIISFFELDEDGYFSLEEGRADIVRFVVVYTDRSESVGVWSGQTTNSGHLPAG